MRQPEVRAGELTNHDHNVTSIETCRRREFSRRRQARISSSRWIAALWVAGSTAAACYRYVPIAPDAAASRDEVRIRLTEDAAARLSKDLGAYVTEIDGQFAPQGADSVAITIPIERQYHGMTVGTTSQVLYLGRSEVVEVEKRQFDRARTALVTAGTVVGFGILAAGIVQLTDPNSDSQDHPPPPPPSPARFPAGYLLKVRIPIP